MFSAALPQISTPMFLPPAQVAYPGTASHVRDFEVLERSAGPGESGGWGGVSPWRGGRKDEPVELGPFSSCSHSRAGDVICAGGEGTGRKRGARGSDSV